MDVCDTCQFIGIRAAGRRPSNRYTGGGHSRDARDNDPPSADWRVVAKPDSEQRLSRSRPRLLFQRNFESGRDQPKAQQVVRDFHTVCVKGRLSWKFGDLQSGRDHVASGCGLLACHYHRRRHAGIIGANFNAIHALRLQRRAPAGRGGPGFHTGWIDWKHRRVLGDAQKVSP